MSPDFVTFPAKESPCYINSLSLFILLSSEKDEQRSTAAVIGLNGLPPWSPLGSAEFAFAQTVLALFPQSPLRLHRPIKAGTFSVFESFSNPSVTACHLPYMANATPEEEIYNPSHSLKFRAIPTDFLLNRDVSRVGNTSE